MLVIAWYALRNALSSFAVILRGEDRESWLFCSDCSLDFLLL